MMMMRTAIFVFLVFAIEYSLSSVSNGSIRNLVAEPEFRAVKLKWNCDQVIQLVSFNIKYCEVTNWQAKNRCKELVVPISKHNEPLVASTDSEEPVVEIFRSGPDSFEASVTNLHMLTNYSITVSPNYDSLATNLDPKFSIHPQVFVETKSFSAKTSRCLANSSDIEVHTGPYFRGKISVEGSSNPACAIFGNRSSEQSVYLLTINHGLCGSKMMNNSRIETMVIVHENREILTHNSRRYMVVCTFAPEIYSLTASVAVPTHLLKKVFDRIREKQFQLSLTSAQADGREVSNLIHHEVTKSPASIERVGGLNKMKRFMVRRDEVRSTSAKQSHLRDSRMLAEDGHVKTNSRRDDSDDTAHHRTHASRYKLLATNQIVMGIVMGSCVLILLWLVVGQYRHGKRKVQYRDANERGQTDRQMVPTVDKITSHQSRAILT